MSTSKVVITSDTGEVQEFTNKKDMEKVIATSNELKWHQTEGGSQLHSDSFISKLGSFGNGPDVNKVLDGTFNSPPGTSVATKDFLNACRRPHNLNIIQSESDILTRYATAMASWEARRESTCTYGQHVGHYKAACRHTFLSWLFFQRGDSSNDRFFTSQTQAVHRPDDPKKSTDI